MGTEANKRKMYEYINIVWKFYKEHCELDLTKDSSWNQINEDYKKMILETESTYKWFVQRAGLGVMEVLSEERKSNG